jgi:hypothetical protein
LELALKLGVNSQTGNVAANSRRFAMPGNPKECRQHALNCMRLAKEATTSQSQETFQNLAQSWTRLAAELEDAQALLNALNEMELKNAPAKLQPPTRTRKQPKFRLTEKRWAVAASEMGPTRQ